LTNPQPFGIMNDMKATQKNPLLDAFLSTLNGGKVREDIIRQGLCMTCDRTTKATFRDEASRNEYRISGMCQSCQDKVFGK
jgi:hypothetical protein